MNISEFKNDIWEPLQQVNQKLNDFIRPVAEELDLTLMQMRAIYTVCEQGNMTIGSLAKSVGITSSNTSVICKRLEAKGFLTRCRNREDERIVGVSPSTKGLEAIAALNLHLEKQFSAGIQQFSGGGLETIKNGLKELDLLLWQLHGKEGTNGKTDSK